MNNKNKQRRIWPILTFFCFFFLPVQHVEAGFFDRVKDIYSAPDKLDELRSQYEETMKSLTEQQQKLEEASLTMDKYAAEQQQLMEENNRFRQQNEALLAQNTQLTQRLEQLEKEEADKKSMYRKWITVLITAVALVAGYILSIRIWRYAVWRRQKQLGRGV